MANVRCPMCSKVNPPEAEACGYCGARLKPIRPSATPAASTPQSDEPEWLRGLRQGEDSEPKEGIPGPSSQQAPPAAGKPSAGKAASSDVPDWLSRIREKAHDETGGSSISSLREDASEEPDWLKGVGDQGQTASNDEGLGGDWLNRLQDPSSGTTPPPASMPGPEQKSVPPFTGMDSGDPSDWMRSLSDDLSAAAPAEAGMDWLSPNSESQPPAFDFGAPAEDSQGGAEDWMSKLSWTDASQESGTPPASGAQDDLNWLSNLNFDTDQPSAPASPPPAAPETPARPSGQDQGQGSFGLSGFLSGLDQPGQQSPSTSPEPPAEEGKKSSSGFGLTGFLSRMNQPEAPSGGEAEPPASAFGDWGQTFESPETPAPSAAESQAGGMDWFSEAPAEPAAPSSDEGAFSSWFQNLESDQPSAAPAQPEPSPFQPEGGLPGWLSGATDEQPASELPPQAPASTGEGGLPGWLSGFSDTTPPASAPAQAPASADQGGLPSWLSGDMPAPAQPPAAEQRPAADAGGMPSWLSGMEEPSTPAPAQPSQPTGADFGGLPSWLGGDVEAAQPAQTDEQSSQLPAGGFEEPGDWFSSFGQAEETSTAQPDSASPFGAAPLELPAEEPAPSASSSEDWFASFAQAGEPEQAPAAASEPPAAISASDDMSGSESVPDWLRDFQSQSTTASSSSVPPLVGEEPPAMAGALDDHPLGMEMPDWLSEEATPKPAEASERSPEAGSENLAQAELPDWVAKMRPLESVIPGEMLPGEIDQRVEKAGPLAGMRGVLPAEEMVTRYRKPPVYSVKLRVTEKQRSQSSLLDNLLAQELQPLLVKSTRSQSQGKLLRMAIALLLLVVLVPPILFGMQPLASPSLFPSDLLEMFDRLDQSLQPDMPVLLAVDYEPALAGEMNLTAASVVDHLMSKNARIVVMSTVTSGPALAQRLLTDVAGRRADDWKNQLAERTVNLGYLPGGTISLLEFAQLPQMAAPVTLSGEPAWGKPALKGISGLTGFSQVIVITDTAETGRAWVEQVQPLMGSVPLFMVVSTQAEPMLLPYVESSQVAGMVSGLMGGAMYSLRAGQAPGPASASSYFATYQIGVLLALALVLAGGLFSGITALIKRKDKDKEEA